MVKDQVMRNVSSKEEEEEGQRSGYEEFDGPVKTVKIGYEELTFIQIKSTRFDQSIVKSKPKGPTKLSTSSLRSSRKSKPKGPNVSFPSIMSCCVTVT